jgi:hypothetical protein
MVDKSTETKKPRLDKTPAPERILRSAGVGVANSQAKGIAVILKLKVELAT